MRFFPSKAKGVVTTATVKMPSLFARDAITGAAPVGAVLCNGGTAGRLYRRWLEPVTGIAAEVLPSTSPANAGWSTERLAERWREALLAALGEGAGRS